MKGTSLFIDLLAAVLLPEESNDQLLSTVMLVGVPLLAIPCTCMFVFVQVYGEEFTGCEHE